MMNKIILITLLMSLNVHAGKVKDMFNEQTSIAQPFELRDPFQSPRFKSEKKIKRQERLSGVRDEQPRLQQDVTLDQLNITGVLIGKERRVLIDIGGQVYKFKEDETIGPSGPKIKAILPGGLILVEQITNIYGEAEYIETVIPISK